MRAAVLVQAAATMPVSMGLAKDHLRVDDAAYDRLITTSLAAAVTEFEDITGRALIDSTWDQTYDSWPCSDRIQLPKGKVSAVLSVKYVDSTGVETAFADWDLDEIDAAVVLKAGKQWPVSQLRSWVAITIRFQAGWENDEAVPADIQTAILFKLQSGVDGIGGANMGVHELEKQRMEAIFSRTAMRYRTHR
ncbi:MAG: hypothetical protein QM757_16550 [Paludibaculum sp.]